MREWNARNPGRMYEVNIHADPSKFLDWDVPLSAQTPSVRSALDDLGVVRTREPEWTVRQSPSGRWTVYNVWGESSGTFKDKGAAEAKAAAGTRDHNVGAAGLAYTRLGGNHVYGSLDGGGASQALNDAGIPGIKYLDKGSRSAGDGSRNYVVFDDKLIEILRKYGIMAPVAGAGLSALSLGDEEGM